MQKYFLCMLMLMAGCLLSAQTASISGRILDAQTREPLSFATVKKLEMPGGAIADSNGIFMIQILERQPSNQKIIVSQIGYIAATVTLTPGDTFQEILLTPDGGGLGEVVISGTMKEVRKADSPVPVEVYSPKFFLRNPTPSLFDAVQMVNGVRPQLQCNVCNTGDIHINGMEGSYTMVLIDGMPIVSGLSTVYGLSGIPNSVLQRMEVVKGPAASLYGSEAMGGLINIITKDPAAAPELRLDLNGSSYGEFNLDGAGSVVLGKARTMLSANYFHFQERHDINRDNFTDVTLQQRISVFNKWRFEYPDNRYAASLAFRYLWEDRYGGEMQWERRWLGSDSIYAESIRTQRLEMLGNAPLLIGGKKINVSFSLNEHRQDSWYGNVPYRALQRIGFGQFIRELKAGSRHDLLLGAGLRFTFYDDNTPVTALFGGENAPQEVWLPGVFVQDEWSINARWKLLSGLRYDHDARHGHILSPRMNLKYSPDEWNTLRLSAGSGFRVVNVFSEDHAALTGGRKVVFAEALKPERTWNINLNYTRFQRLPKGFVNLDATLFYTYFFNKIRGDYDINPEEIVYANLDGYAENRGFSLNSDWNFTNGWKALLGFTLMDVATVENRRRDWQVHTPHGTGNWSFSFPLLSQRLTVDYNGYAYSPMRLPVFPNDYRPEYSPWFSIHNIQLTWKLGNDLEMYGGVKNLFNFYPKEDVIMRAFDPFDKEINDPAGNPNGYTFDPSYNYAAVQGIRGFAGLRLVWH